MYMIKFGLPTSGATIPHALYVTTCDDYLEDTDYDYAFTSSRSYADKYRTRAEAEDHIEQLGLTNVFIIEE